MSCWISLTITSILLMQACDSWIQMDLIHTHSISQYEAGEIAHTPDKLKRYIVSHLIQTWTSSNQKFNMHMGKLELIDSKQEQPIKKNVYKLRDWKGIRWTLKHSEKKNVYNQLSSLEKLLQMLGDRIRISMIYSLSHSKNWIWTEKEGRKEGKNND